MVVASPTTAHYVHEQLKQNQVEDHETLTLFFETLLANNFAYTLFGDKPVSCDTYSIEGDGSRKSSCLNYGKKIWAQYSSLFPLSKFIFKYQRRDFLEDIFLINKDAFLQTVNQNLPLFQSILGSDVTPEKLLDKISQENTTYEEVLHYHSGLIGLLYGFGYTNAFSYYKIDDLELEVQKWIHPPMYFFKEDASLELYTDPFSYLQKCSVPTELKATYEKLSNIDMLQNPCPEEDPLSLTNLSLFPLPAFGANCKNRIETRALIEKYKKTRHDIVCAYQQGDFLEVTLCKLIEQ